MHAARADSAKENQKAKVKWQRVKVKDRTFKNPCSKNKKLRYGNAGLPESPRSGRHHVAHGASRG
jgi:hypothetical protein